jgi:hypothetical protein
MKTMWNILAVAHACCCCGLAQPKALDLVGSSYTLVQPFVVAPGQLVTLIVDLGSFPSGIFESARAPAGADLPSSLGGISGGYFELFRNPPLPQPILEVRPYWGECPPLALGDCVQLAAITIQIPFEGEPLGGVAGARMRFSSGEMRGPSVEVYTNPDQVHVLTTCDAFMLPPVKIISPNSLPSGTTATLGVTGLPCPSVVAHGDGSLVSVQSPAQPGEVVVAYAVGLGQTNPPSATGKVVTAAVPTQTTFGLDFNYHPNALPSKPLPNAPAPLFAGATPGFVGLYQINFKVPPSPAGTPPCVPAPEFRSGDPSNTGQNVVYSNLTVSIGGGWSFDGARMCVAVNGPK